MQPHGPTRLTTLDHPILQHKLTLLRDQATSPATFRTIMQEMSELLAYEATRDLVTRVVSVRTPLEEVQGAQLAEPVLLVPILRAGQGMLQGFLNLLPLATVGHIGIYRDKFIDTCVEYFFRLPSDTEGRRVLILDPLLATGDTAVAAVDRVKEYDVGSIRLVCLLAAPEGLARLGAAHPEVEVLTVSVERGLNADGYIVPGIGDAGDRLYGT